jgi:uncharacterized protein YprB with RNaseH-like and TPR domain
VALETLLHYNREDVVNLYKLEAVLGITATVAENPTTHRRFE